MGERDCKIIIGRLILHFKGYPEDNRNFKRLKIAT